MDGVKSVLLFIAVITTSILAFLVVVHLGIFDENTGGIITIVFVVAILIITAVWILYISRTNKPTALLTATGVDVKGPMVNLSVAFNDINSIELRDNMKYGIRTFGFATANIYGGSFSNSEFKSYKMSVDNRIKKFIVLHHKDGILVFNLDSPGTTQAMYDSIRKRSKKVTDGD